MGNLSKLFFTTIWLFAICIVIQSCSEQGVQLEKQQVQFTIRPAANDNARTGEIVLPENSRAIISVANSSGAAILTSHEVSVIKTADGYTTDVVELLPGGYVITEFLIVKDSIDLYVTPKSDAAITLEGRDALPYNFSVAQGAATINMLVMDVRNESIEKFGYANGKAKGNNSLSLAIYDLKSSLTTATAEIRQNNKLINKLTLAAAVNTLTLGGDHKLPYTLLVYTANGATTKTFDIKSLKREIGKGHLKLQLEPALVLTVQSSVDAGNEYEEYFEFRMDGHGSVNINWGDGGRTSATLPFEVSHEYIAGDYNMIVTGDISKATDFAGFSYGTIISAITGLTNLTSLKVYDPSWGAVPIKVDLSNCKKLERINVAKYGAPYEPSDLRTDFKLPTKHQINAFIFDAPSFDINREFISAEELEVMVNNIYLNTLNRQIYNGKFFVNPVVTPSAATQQKLDVLRNEYNWAIGFNDEIYSAYDLQAGRVKNNSDTDSKREEWLRSRFSKSEQIIGRAQAVASLN